MFGMDDPNKVLIQYRRYVQDGRLELAEVMAKGLSDRMSTIPQKERDLEMQGILVDALRDLLAILEIREKWKDGVSTIRPFLKERKVYWDRLRKEEKQELSDAVAFETADWVQLGRLYAGVKKYKSALKAWKSARKIEPEHLEAALRPLDMLLRKNGSLTKAGNSAKELISALKALGPVTQQGKMHIVTPRGDHPHPLERVLSDIDRFVGGGIADGEARQLNDIADQLRKQKEAIETGLQAANAEMASALDKLQVTQDYHEWAGGGR